jgi:threonine/homoserine/homoserine lactone efflux protein
MRILLGLILFALGTVVTAAGLMTAYFRDPLATTVILLGMGVLIIAAGVGVTYHVAPFRRRRRRKTETTRTGMSR